VRVCVSTPIFLTCLSFSLLIDGITICICICIEGSAGVLRGTGQV